MTESLKDIKKSLEKALGPDDFEKYLKLLRKWFAQNLTKWQFDSEAQKLISPEAVRFHNELFVAILTKCNIPSSASLLSPSGASTSSTGTKKRKGLQALRQIISKNSSHGHEKRFRASDPFPTAQPAMQSPSVQDPPSSFSDNLTICAKDGLLPDRSAMFLRSLLIAWEAGMEEISEESAALLVLATRDMLKNIMQSAVQLRRNFMVSSSFPHSFGVGASGNTEVKTNENVGRLYSDLNLIAATRSKPTSKISLRDVYDGLKVRPDVLPCQSVSAVVLERILCKLEEKEDSPKRKTSLP